MTVFKLVRFSRLLKMNWHFVAKAILGKMELTYLIL